MNRTDYILIILSVTILCCSGTRGPGKNDVVCKILYSDQTTPSQSVASALSVRCSPSPKSVEKIENSASYILRNLDAGQRYKVTAYVTIQNRVTLKEEEILLGTFSNVHQELGEVVLEIPVTLPGTNERVETEIKHALDTGRVVPGRTQ